MRPDLFVSQLRMEMCIVNLETLPGTRIKYWFKSPVITYEHVEVNCVILHG